MLKIITLIVLFVNFSLAFADTLFLSRTGLSTYVQEEEFMVADGENVIGPIFLKPIAVTEGILVEADGIEIEGYFLENTSKNWKENLKGKFISVEGEGRVVKGTVIELDKEFIKINTRKGFVVTTIPKFPSRIKSPLKWDELFSPQITLKVKSKLAQSQIFRISYPVEGLSWDAEYVINKKNSEMYLTGFVNIKNTTPVEFKNLTVVLIDRDYKKDMGEIHINSFGEKKLKFIQKKITEKEILDIPDGKVSIYENGIFTGYRFIKSGTLH
ncbi:hypothetical protein [Persephonella sp.]